jgi:hypothetical protein
VTVRLRQLSRAACPPGQGPESVTGRVVSEGVCHEAFDYRHGYGRREATRPREDLGHASFMIMRAERYLRRPAPRDVTGGIRPSGTRRHAALCGHPGFVPGGYLAGLSVEATITAAELCTADMRERVHSGERVLG